MTALELKDQEAWGRERCQDITAIWNRCHPHLLPITEHLPIDKGIKAANPRHHGTVSVMAFLRFVGNEWSAKPHEVRFVREDGRFLVQSFQRVTAVNARLWFSSPSFLNLEPTTRCNFSCWYCVGRHMKQEDIHIDGFRAALENFPQLRTLALVGEGEPLMHKQFFEMASLARERGIRVMIVSNGSTLSASIVRKLCEHEVAYVAISIDSINAAQFSSSRVNGRLQQVLRGITRLRKFRDANGYRFPKIGLKGTLFESTEGELPEIAEKARAHGVEVFESFQPLNAMESYVKIYPRNQLDELKSAGRVAGAIDRDSKQALRILQSTADFCAEEGIELFGEPLRNPLRRNCDEQWIYALLSGDVTPCCQIKNPISPRWNLFENTIEEILADPEYENLRFNLWNGLFPQYCAGCWKTRV